MVHDGIRLAIPTMNDSTEKPRPASDHDQDISSIMKGITTPSDVNVAAVIWKKIRLTSANFVQLCLAKFVDVPVAGELDIYFNFEQLHV
jgi:hypothetical protein